MKNTINRKSVLYTGMIMASLLASLLVIQSASAMITSQLDFGDQNGEVTELQTYLATNANIYPSGLVTGYFGALTQAGVQRFQAAQGIVSSGSPSTTGYGRVGPTTMARINSLLGSAPGPIYWDTVPVLSAATVQPGQTTVTISWTTNEPTQGQVYWATTPLQFDEATGPGQRPYVSGALATDAGGLLTSHTVMVSNLQANTTYYYLVRAIDSVGNISIIWPSTFRTSN